MRKSFTITVEETVAKQFRDICKEQGVQQSMLVEAFMRSYVQGKIEVHLTLGNKNTTVSVIE